MTRESLLPSEAVEPYQYETLQEQLGDSATVVNVNKLTLDRVVWADPAPGRRIPPSCVSYSKSGLALGLKITEWLGDPSRLNVGVAESGGLKVIMIKASDTGPKVTKIKSTRYIKHPKIMDLLQTRGLEYGFYRGEKRTYRGTLIIVCRKEEPADD